MPAAFARCAPSERLEEAPRLLAVGEEENRDERVLLRNGVGDRLRPFLLPDRLLAEVDGRGERVAERGPAVGLEEVELVHATARTRSRSVVGGAATSGSLENAISPDAHVLRHALEERSHGRLRGSETRRLDVGRVHRARHVDDEDDRRLVRRDERRAVRPRERDAEKREREQEQRRREEAPRRALADDRREHVEVRERHRIAHAASLGEQVRGDRERDDEQRQQQDRAVEAHLPPAQTAATCTTARPSPPRADTVR